MYGPHNFQIDESMRGVSSQEEENNGIEAQATDHHLKPLANNSIDNLDAVFGTCDFQLLLGNEKKRSERVEYRAPKYQLGETRRLADQNH